MPVDRPFRLGEPPDRLDPRMMFAPDRSSMYVAVPKTGCTTIKTILAACVGLLDPGALERASQAAVHRTWNARPVTWMALSEEEREDLLASATTFRFTSVRNPFERVVSCYLNKVVKPADSSHLARRVHDQGDVSLLAFLKFVRGQRPWRRDVHCRPMTDLCFSGHVAYEDIIRYETFDRDIRRVMSKLNFPEVNIPSPSVANRTDAGRRMHALLGPQECALIREIYREDFQEFGYSADFT
jgi:Sulfotransferase family